MPELAEVETLARYLRKYILSQNIVSCRVYRDKLRYDLDPNLKTITERHSIIDIQRRAKFLNIKLSNDYSLVVHLGMSGRLTIQPPEYHLLKHDHVLITLGNSHHLVFNDSRRFGMIYYCLSNEFAQQDFFKNMGMEPLIDGFNSSYLARVSQNRNIPIKTLIMDNKIVVGVGNIYASESLFAAKIHPRSIAKTITMAQFKMLVYSIKQVLSRAISAGGTTLKDFVNANNTPGYFKQQLNVYDREGEKCYSCNTFIKRIHQAGRSSFFCPKCQR